MMTMTTLSDRIKAAGLKARVDYGDYNKVPEDFRDSTPWKVTLRMAGRSLTVPFYTGPAITREPSAADVLECLLDDSSSFENASSFEEWAEEFGYDTDSRKAERTYKAVEAQAKKLRRFLGDDYEDWLWHTERDS